MTELYPNPPTTTDDARPGLPERERRHDLSDEAWRHVERYLTRRAKTGRPPTNARTLLSAILWLLATGAPWRDLPARFGPWQTVYGRFVPGAFRA
jgi:transposase